LPPAPLMDRAGAEPAAGGRAASRGAVGRGRARSPRPREATTAASSPRIGRRARPACLAGQRAKSTMALGILLAVRPYLPELATRADAGSHPRLRHDPRTDASRAHGSFTEVLESRRGGLP